MKTILIITMSFCIALSADAQHGHAGFGTRIVVAGPGVGYGYGYAPYYPAYGYPYGYYGYTPAPLSKLDMQIDAIKTDYADKIKSAKSDKDLVRAERNNIIDGLKADRDKAISDCKRNYYKS